MVPFNRVMLSRTQIGVGVMAKAMVFPVTHWSLVKRAGAADAVARREALQLLLERYIPTLRYFLCITFRFREEEASDLLQAFVADQLLVKQLISQADKSKGRFRSFLLVSLRNYTIDVFRQQKGSQKLLSDEPEFADRKVNSDLLIQASWARTLLNNVMVAMKRECEESGRMDIWQVFEERVLSPIFSQTVPPSYENLAQRLGLVSPTQAANLLVTGKRTYTRLLRAAVGEYEQGPGEIDNEIRELWRVLSEVPAFQESATME